MIADPSVAETESLERRNMIMDKFASFVVGLLCGCWAGVFFITIKSGGTEEKMLHYRSVLIKHGVAEYRADENGEPMFVIKAEPIKP